MSNPKHRPTHKELFGKICSARKAFEADRFAPAVPSKLAANFYGLNLFSPEDQYSALISAIHEIAPGDYDGGRPPAKSYEPGPVYGLEMFAFAWDSCRFKRRMYFKFSLVLREDEVPFVYVFSLHREQPKSRKGG